MTAGHTVKSYDEALGRLTRDVLAMGGLVESQLASAVQALVRRDGELAAQVIANDQRIDELEIRIDEQVTRILALRQPMAGDLRLVKTALKMSSDLERMGDLAANTAKRSLALTQADPVALRAAIARMADVVQAMIKDVLDAFAQRDADKAIAVRQRDTEVDEIYNGVFRALLTYMMEDQAHITPCTHLLFIAKNIERIGDHTTNVAEMVAYLVKGATPAEERTKGDTTSTFAGPAGPGAP
ncbi:MAG: phosphate signaling complex protein PhoU [Alphaproteobacteria bacterium]|nr:phosphate signaling complex protein PhoU [Alphaproteobacteria bacterium]